MIQYKFEDQVVVKKLLQSITCDICGRTYPVDNTFEVQEFHHIHFTGGYGSVFGDGDRIECDICQHCLLKMTYGKFRIIEEC